MVIETEAEIEAETEESQPRVDMDEVIEEFEAKIPKSRRLATDCTEFLEKLKEWKEETNVAEFEELREQFESVETQRNELSEKLDKTEGELSEVEEVAETAEDNLENFARFLEDVCEREPDATLRNKILRIMEEVRLKKGEVDLSIFRLKF